MLLPTLALNLSLSVLFPLCMDSFKIKGYPRVAAKGSTKTIGLEAEKQCTQKDNIRQSVISAD